MGWARGCSSSRRLGNLQAFLPIILYALLFGLSIDYAVRTRWRYRTDR